MPWDDQKALKATQRFFDLLQQVEEEYPTVIARLRDGWKQAYLDSGHKRLGRVLVGESVERACR